MDILDRLLGHDAWTTRQLLLCCRALSDESLDRRFDIGDRSLRETFLHLLENIVHVITHSMHHRAQALYLMEQLGLKDLPEGDPLDGEHKVFGWRSG